MARVLLLRWWPKEAIRRVPLLALVHCWEGGKLTSRHILHGLQPFLSSETSSLGLEASGTVDSTHSFILLWFQPQPALHGKALDRKVTRMGGHSSHHGRGVSEWVEAEAKEALAANQVGTVADKMPSFVANFLGWLCLYNCFKSVFPLPILLRLKCWILYFPSKNVNKDFIFFNYCCRECFPLGKLKFNNFSSAKLTISLFSPWWL